MGFLFGSKIKARGSWLAACILLASCSPAFHIGKTAKEEVIQNKALASAFMNQLPINTGTSIRGISILFQPAIQRSPPVMLR